MMASDQPGGSSAGSGTGRLSVFISYAREDGDIVDALNNALSYAFGDALAVFVDRVSLQQGDDLRGAINAHLDRADVLMVVSTGVERPSHDWAGYELGYFSARNATRQVPLGGVKGSIIIFSAPGTSPRPMEGRLHIELDAGDNTAWIRAGGEPPPIGDDHPILGVFARFHEYLRGGELSLNLKESGRIKRIISELECKVASELMRRPKAVFKPLKRFTVRYACPGGSAPRPSLPSDAAIEFFGGGSKVFGLAPVREERSIRWEEFCRLARFHELGVFWCGTIERFVMEVGDRGSIELDTGSVLPAHDNRELYRLIPTTCTLFHDHTVEVSVSLIEVLKQPDVGNAQTTRILKGLGIICRFRFLFLEPESKYNAVNFSMGNPIRVRELARQLVSELDFMLADTYQAGLDQPASWGALIDTQSLMAMAQEWQPLRSSLTDCCRELLSGSTEADGTQNANRLASTLSEIEKRMRPHNNHCLKLLAQRLLEQSS